MIKAEEARLLAQKAREAFNSEYRTKALDFIERVIEPNIKKAVENGDEDVKIQMDEYIPEKVVHQIRNILNENGYYIVSTSQGNIWIEWKEMIALPRYPDDGIGETIKPVYRDRCPNPMFKIT